MTGKIPICLVAVPIIMGAAAAVAQDASTLPQAPINATAQDCESLVRRFQVIQMKQSDDMRACMRETRFGTCPNEAGGQEGSAYVQCCPLARKIKQINKTMDEETRKCYERSNSVDRNSNAVSSSSADWNDAGSHKSATTSGDVLPETIWRSTAGNIRKGDITPYKPVEPYVDRARVEAKQREFTQSEAEALKDIVERDRFLRQLIQGQQGLEALNFILSQNIAGPVNVFVNWNGNLIGQWAKANAYLIAAGDYKICERIAEQTIDPSPNSDLFYVLLKARGCPQ